MNNNWMILMRGLAGSGKTTMVDGIVEFANMNYIPVVVRSTDYFWMEDGEYKFDASKLGKAHEWNQEHVKKSIESNVNWIIVDNTNTTYKECAPYIEMAANNGYNLALRTPPHLWAFDVDICAERNTHNVPKEAIQKMKDRFVSNANLIDMILEDYHHVYKTADHYEYDLEVKNKQHVGNSEKINT